MAIPFLNNITLNNNEIQNVRLQNAGSPPLNSGPGQIYFDSTQLPTIVDTAKYYANSTDTWVSLKEYTFPAVAKADGYITSTITGTTPKPIVKFNLNATGTADETTYLRGDNQWEPISAIPGTYSFVISDNATPTENTGIVAEDDTVQIAANADLTSLLTGGATASKVLTVGLKVDSGLGNANNYVLNQGTEVAAAGDTIPFNDYTPGATPPSTQTNIVKKTTFGTIPVDALTLVKQYIDDSVAGGLIYQGGYNADTNTPDLTTSPNSILKGWTYTVTADGAFFGEQLRVGDVLIAEVNDPSALTDWTTVQNNIDLASLTQVGIGNVNEATAAPLKGLSVTYASGTATAGLNISGLTTQAPANNALAFIPFYDQQAGANLKVGLSTLAGDLNEFTSKAFTISDTDTIIHGYNTRDVIVQLYDTDTYETVYADVDRTSLTEVTITFATTPDNDVRVLVQKIG